MQCLQGVQRAQRNANRVQRVDVSFKRVDPDESRVLRFAPATRRGNGGASAYLDHYNDWLSSSGLTHATQVVAG